MDDQLPLDLDQLAVPVVSIHVAGITAADLRPAPVPAWRWEVWVPGVPAPQGSKVAVPRPGGKGVWLREARSKTLDAWRAQVTRVAADAWPMRWPWAGPVLLGCAFRVAPYKKTRPEDWPVGGKIADLDKVLRAVGDALTRAKVWEDDRQVVGYLDGTGKRFARPGEESGCRITLRPAGRAEDAP